MSIGALHESGEMPGLGRAQVRNKYSALMGEDLKQHVEIESRVAALLQETFLTGQEGEDCEGSYCRVEQVKTVITWRDLEEALEKYGTTSTLRIMLEEGKTPAFEGVQLKAYRWHWESFMVVGSVVLFKDRILVPEALREQILQTLHQGHQRVTSRALLVVYRKILQWEIFPLVENSPVHA